MKNSSRTFRLVATKIGATVFGVVLLGSSAFAATLVCSGTIDYVQYDSNDLFSIKLSSMNMPVTFCNSTATWSVTAGYTTSAESCKMMYATFLAAKLSGTPLTAVYFDANSVPASCNTWASQQFVSIRHYLVQ